MKHFDRTRCAVKDAASLTDTLSKLGQWMLRTPDTQDKETALWGNSDKFN